MKDEREKMSLIHPSSFILHPSEVAVVKVGGSLYDLPDLGFRLRRWLAEHFADDHVILVPGGGGTAAVIRDLDRRHGLGEETSHWLALRALGLNAHFLAALLPPAWVAGKIEALGAAWEKNRLAVLDVHEFARDDEDRPGHLPHDWTVTSDALAARVAMVVEARHLVLLKSTTIPPSMDWTEVGRLGVVDERFAEVLREAPAALRVSAVNLRTWQA
jgi:5-(aminomethyl)-3-furanmethanol phosphate kinase